MSRIENIPTSYLECRSLQHAWRYFDVEKDGRKKVYHEILVCGRCNTTKTRFIGFNGDIAQTPRYDYPKEYLLQGEGGNTQEDRPDIRIHTLEAHIEGHKVPAAKTRRKSATATKKTTSAAPAKAGTEKVTTAKKLIPAVTEEPKVLGATKTTRTVSRKSSAAAKATSPRKVPAKKPAAVASRTRRKAAVK